MIEPFLLRALAAGLGLAVLTAPLGCFVVWSRMTYIGETIAQAGLIGVALGLLIGADVSLAVLLTTLAAAGLLVLLSRQHLLPLDSILGLIAHAALALGVILAALVKGPPVDLVGFLFGDIFAVSTGDLVRIWGGGALVLAVLTWLWQPLVRLAVHAELAAAEGIDREWTRAVFTLILAVAIAVSIKIVGVLLAVAFLIMPAAAARPFSQTPERMAGLAAVVAALAVIGGLWLSLTLDVPGGAAIVLVMATLAFGALGVSLRRAGR